MTNPSDLYQEVILDHNRRPRNYGSLPDASHRAEGHNPLCGDHIRVALNLKDESISAIAFEGESCAICKASASMMTTAIKGRSRADAEALILAFRDMATGQERPEEPQPDKLGRLRVFEGVRDLPTRVDWRSLLGRALHDTLGIGQADLQKILPGMPGLV